MALDMGELEMGRGLRIKNLVLLKSVILVGYLTTSHLKTLLVALTLLLIYLILLLKIQVLLKKEKAHRDLSEVVKHLRLFSCFI